MKCQKAKKLISLYVAPNGPWFSPKDCHALEVHVAVCEPCREECRESREVIDILQKYWQVSEDTAALLETRRQGNQHGISTRIIKLHRHSVFRQAAMWAMAACLGIAVLISLDSPNREVVLTEPNHSVAFTDEDLPLVIELADAGHIVPGTVIQTSAGEIRSLVLNGRHRVVMNAGTKLSIQSPSEAGKAGWLISLALGEVCVHVEHDGNPFVVATAHGRAVITGTIFDVSVTDYETALMVAEGSVRFESDLGKVDVMMGHRSTLRAQSKPTEPLACNVETMIAWAGKIHNEIQPHVEEWPFDITELVNESLSSTLYPTVSQTIDLESLDYDEFVESKRQWFEGQFPWIFELQKVLNDKKINVDYPELLMKTGDIWQIVYPERAYRIISVIDPNSLLVVAKEYDLGENLYCRIIASANQYQSQKYGIAIGAAALEGWLAECRNISTESNDLENATCEYAFTIGEYLENTRAIAWLYIKNGIVEISAENKSKVLEFLQQQVLAAYTCKEIAGYLSVHMLKSHACASNDKQLRKLIEAIEKLIECERKIIQCRRPASNF